MGGVVIAAGGTGGHLYPALAVAAEVKSLAPEAEIVFMGAQRGMGPAIVRRAGFGFMPVAGSPWDRGRPFTLLSSGLRTVQGALQAGRLMREFGARVVFSTGGYAAAPSMLAAILRGIPLVLHEPDAVPGAVNRIFGRWAGKVTLGSAEGAGCFPEAKRRVTGVPVRPDLFGKEKGRAREELGLSRESRVILVLGGSQGARPINSAMLEALPALAKAGGLEIVWLCGEREEAKVRESLGALPGPVSSLPVKLFGYLDDIAPALAAADLAFARAGASSLAEILGFGIPSILVPYPHAASDHQSRNAQALAGAGAAEVLRQGELSGDRLAKDLLRLLNEPARLAGMARAAAGLARPKAAREVAQEVLAAMSRGAPC